MKKGFLILALCAWVAAGAAWYYSRGDDPTRGAERFLRLLAAGQLEKAYALTTDEFHLHASKGALLVMSQRLGLDQYQGAEWTSRDAPHPTTTLLEGRASLADGAEVFLEMRLEKVDGDWRVDYLGKSKGDLAVPADTELRRLVTDTMLGLGTAIADGDFEQFRTGCARSLRMMNTEKELQHSFALIDYSFVKELRPNFSKLPTLDHQGNLHLIGHYDTSPSRMEFLMNFTHEQAEWRLTTLHIHLVDVYEQQAERFVQHLARRQYDNAYELTSTEFRRNADVGRLRVVAEHLRLDQNAVPKWTKQDSRDDVIMLDGDIPTAGGDVHVEVGMVLEGSAWKVHYLR